MANSVSTNSDVVVAKAETGDLPALPGKLTRIGPQTESAADNATVLHFEELVGFVSFGAGVFGDQYTLQPPLAPLPLELRSWEHIIQCNPGPCVSHVTIEVYDDFAPVPDNVTPPYGGTLLYTATQVFNMPVAGGYILGPIPITPVLEMDVIDPGDPTIFWKHSWQVGDAAGPPDLAIQPFFSGDTAVIGSSDTWAWRDQTGDGLLTLAPTAVPPGPAGDGGCVGGFAGEPTCDRRSLQAGPAHWTIHLRGVPDQRFLDPGDDLLQTLDCSTFDPGDVLGASALDFGDDGTDCSADSGGLGSDPVVGPIAMRGRPLGSDFGIGFTDTIIRRTEIAGLPTPGASDTIAIELVALSLASTQPIVVTRGGGAVVETWDFQVCLSGGGQTQGSMTINRSSCDGDGGTFSYSLPIIPKIIATRLTGGGPCTVSLDYPVFALPGVAVSGAGSYYDGDISNLNLYEDSFGGVTVDGDCNLQLTASDPVLGPTAAFKPGVYLPKCSGAGCDPDPDPAVGQVPGVGDVNPRGNKLDTLWIASIADDTDTDLDGAPDDGDNCGLVPNRCQEDSDLDAVGDACDLCPLDCNKVDPGICGCGVSDDDSDGDGIPDCNDGCPTDPNKTEPGQCGCNTPDTDGDGDGVADCVDNCPVDPNPDQADSDGDGDGDVCDVPDCPDGDNDGDGVCNGDDNCPDDANATQADADMDGVGDACDDCPNSNTSATVKIGRCDSRAPNDVLPNGCTISDLIKACKDQSRNHGQFVRCVVHLVHQLRHDGYLTSREAAKIIKCAAKKGRNDDDSGSAHGHRDRDDHSDNNSDRDHGRGQDRRDDDDSGSGRRGRH
jgi:hypothetical protein